MASFTSFMRTWESELNHYLATGEKLQADERGSATAG